MKNQPDILMDESGSLMVMVILLLAVLTILASTGNRGTTTEVAIATNDQFQKIAHYTADGGTSVGIELLEQNIEAAGTMPIAVGDVTLPSANFAFYMNVMDEVNDTNNFPSTTNWDAQLTGLNNQTIYLKMYGNTQLSQGSALQIAAGYEGKGEGLAGGGAQIFYDIRSLATGMRNTRSQVRSQYLHQ